MCDKKNNFYNLIFKDDSLNKCMPKKLLGEKCKIGGNECFDGYLDCIDKVCKCKDKSWIEIDFVCKKCPIYISDKICKAYYKIF